ncbi:MAG TPA: S41 family peptidase [Vicinamibacterales bacterium]|nr:S41 family peptidase [Vicinamibacterales bacterium]
MRRRAAALLVAGVLGLPLAMQAQAPRALETFDAVWTKVRDTHFDPGFDEQAWDRVRAELRPRAAAAKTPGELRDVLRDMLGRLGLSHFAIIPSSPDAPGDNADFSGEPGFDVRLIGHDLVVSRVEPDGGAAAAGVRPGWKIERIDGTTAASLLDAITAATPERIARLAAWRAAVTRLRGPSGTSVTVTFSEADGATLTRTITRHGEPGQAVTVGNLPTFHVRVEATPLTTPAGAPVGLIRFNVWMAAVDAPFARAIDRFRASDGIIIDLRGNPGGLAAMIMGIAGHFLDQRVALGVMKTREGELRFTANPRLVDADGARVEPFKGPVAILVDGLTGSASECFAGGMQAIGRARVFGRTSMGQALPALFDQLPNGDVFIHAWGDFETADGTRLEGRGVIPDEPAPLTRADLAAGRDAAEAAALAWIDRARKSQGEPQLPALRLRLAGPSGRLGSPAHAAFPAIIRTISGEVHGAAPAASR